MSLFQGLKSGRPFQSLSFGKARGQIAFELLMVLAVILLVSATFMLESTDQAFAGFIYPAVRNSAEHQAALLSFSGDCQYSAPAVSFADGEVNISSSCPINASKVANQVEQYYCSKEIPNNDSVINCGDKSFVVTVY
ncbi:MAG: hypothetical protein V1911_04105 [Candidatus Micrarchaeota archaeon]